MPRPRRHRPKPRKRRLPRSDTGGPQRTCIGCRRVASQDDLVRIVRRDDGTVQAGRTLPGRGAWLCADSPACLQRAARRGALSRALRASVNGGEVLARGWESLFEPDRP